MLVFGGVGYAITRGINGIVLRRLKKSGTQLGLFGDFAEPVRLTPKGKKRQAATPVVPTPVEPPAPKVQPKTPKKQSPKGPQKAAKGPKTKIDDQGRTWIRNDNTGRFRLARPDEVPTVKPAIGGLQILQDDEPVPVEDKPTPEPAPELTVTSSAPPASGAAALRERLSGVSGSAKFKADLEEGLTRLETEGSEGAASFVRKIENLEPQKAAQTLVDGIRAIRKLEGVKQKSDRDAELIGREATAIAAPKEQLSGQSAKNVARLLHDLGIADKVFQSDDFHLRLTNEGYEPLVIEKHGDELYLTHYYEKGGDTVMDAEMVFKVFPNGQIKIHQTAVENPIRGGESRGLDRSFANAFARNLVQQGWGKPDSRTSSTHPEFNEGGAAATTTASPSDVTAPEESTQATIPVEAIRIPSMPTIDGIAQDAAVKNDLEDSREGDRKTINGVNYELRGGRWHRVDEEDLGVSEVGGADSLPDRVKSQIQAAIDSIKGINKRIEEGQYLDRQQGGGGRYEADVWTNLGGIKAAGSSAITKIEHYRQYAPDHNVDYDKALEELGYEPILEPSQQAREWLGEQSDSQAKPAISAEKGSEESLDEKSYREFAENFDRVMNDPASASDKDIIRAISYTDKVILKERDKERKGRGVANQDLIHSLNLEASSLKQILKDREVGDKSEPAIAEPLPGPPIPVEQLPAPSLGPDRVDVDYEMVKGKRTRQRINKQVRDLLSEKPNGPFDEEELALLAKYSGRGNIGDGEASLNEYYTRPDVAKFATEILSRHGFTNGTVFEPSCGTGVFLGQFDRGDVLPVGVELDETSSQCAKHLNPHADVSTTRFERFLLDDPEFQADGIIGNIPFGTRMIDSDLEASKYKLSEYRTNEALFLNESMDRLKPGQPMVMVVPHGVMTGSQHSTLRQQLAKKGRLVGAYRLPDDAFKHSGTAVVTDIIVLQKHPDEVLNGIRKGDDQVLQAIADPAFVGGAYFENNPQNILGEVSHYMRGDREAFTVKGNVSEAIKNVQPLESAITYEGIELAAQEEVAAKVGDERYINGRLYRLEGDPPRWHLVEAQADTPVDADASAYGADSVEQAIANLQDIGKRVQIHPDHLEASARLAGGVLSQSEINALRDAGKAAKRGANPHEAQKFAHAALLGHYLKALQQGDPDARDLEYALGMLQHYRDLHGNPNSDRKLAVVANDFPGIFVLQGAFSADGEVSDYFAGKTQKSSDRVFDTATGAVSEAYRAGGGTAVNLFEFREALPENLQALGEDDLRAAVLADPAVGYLGDRFLPMDRLMIGDGYQLIEAFAAEAEMHPEGSPERRKLMEQVAIARSKMQTRSIEEMSVHLWGVGQWIPTDALNQFLKDRGIRAQYTRTPDGKFENQTYSEGKLESGISRTLNQEKIRGNETASYNYPLKKAIADLEDDFKQWLAASDYRFEVEDTYNRAFNARIDGEHSGDPMEIKGFDQHDGDPANGVRAKQLHHYQTSTIRQMADSGRGIIALGVGLGKTSTSIGLAMHLRETGRVNKAGFVVPKSVMANWVKELRFWAPGAKVAMLGMSQKYWADGSEAYEIPGFTIAMAGEKQQFLKDGSPLMRVPGFQFKMKGTGRTAKYETDKDGNYLLYSEDEEDLPAKERSHVALTPAEVEKRALHVYAGGTGAPERDADGNYTLYADDDPNRQNPVKATEAELKARGVLAMTPDDKATREKKLQEVAQNQYDIVLMSEPVFQKIGLSPDRHLTYMEGIVGNHLNPESSAADKEVAKLRSLAAAENADREGERKTENGKTYELRGGHWHLVQEDGSYKMLQRQEAMKAGLLERDFNDRSGNIYWEDLGIDGLFADEAHHHKNLFAPFRNGSDVAFLSTAQSKRSLDFYFKSQYTRETANNQNVYLMTATPTTNNPLEAYNMLMHVCPDELEKRGIYNIDQFLQHFGEIREVQTIGVDLQPTVKNGLVGFQNLKDLRQLFNQYCRMQQAEDVGLEIPKEADHTVDVEMSPAQKAVYDQLRERAAEMIEKMKDPNQKHEEGDDHIFSIISDMDKAAIDLNYYNDTRSPYGPDPELGDADSNSPKIQACAERVMASQIGNRGKQIVFCDAVQLHESLKQQLVDAGYPADEIMIVNAGTAKSPSDRQKISQAYNAGKITLVIGNTATMGEGMNFQIGTTDIHHLTTPWTPAAIEQRNGRGVRQGNELDSVGIHYYQAKGSFDAYRKLTNDRKRGWIDELWQGEADTASNQNVGLGGDDLLFLFSDDPEKARQELEANKELQMAKLAEQNQKKAVQQFKSLQAQKAVYAKMGEKDRLTDKGKQIKQAIATATRSLASNEYFPHKALLDNEHPVHIADDGQVLAVGCHVKGHDGSVYRLTKVDLSKKKFTATQIAGSDYRPGQFSADHEVEGSFKGLVGEDGLYKGLFTTTDYNDDLHVERVIKAASSYSDFQSMSPEMVNANRDRVIERLRSGYDNVAWLDGAGKLNVSYGNKVPADATILMPHDGAAVDRVLQEMGKQQAEGGTADYKLGSVIEGLTGKKAVKSGYYGTADPELAAKLAKYTEEFSPKPGDRRINAAGNPEEFRDGRWHRVEQPTTQVGVNPKIAREGAAVPRFEHYEDAYDHVDDALLTVGAIPKEFARDVARKVARLLTRETNRVDVLNQVIETANINGYDADEEQFNRIVDAVLDGQSVEPEAAPALDHPTSPPAPGGLAQDEQMARLNKRVMSLDDYGNLGKQQAKDALTTLSQNKNIALGQQYLRELDQLSNSLTSQQLIAETVRRADSLRTGTPLAAMPKEPHPDPLGAIQSAIAHLNGNNTDGARERNNVGFNQFDTEWGRNTANSLEAGNALTGDRAREALRRISKYANTQLTEAGIVLPTADELEKQLADMPSETIQSSIQQTRHAKKGIDLHVVVLDERIDYDKFKHLKDKAQQHGGYWSSYDKRGAIPGFQFESPEEAEEFHGYVSSLAKAATVELGGVKFVALADDKHGIRLQSLQLAGAR